MSFHWNLSSEDELEGEEEEEELIDHSFLVQSDSKPAPRSASASNESVVPPVTAAAAVSTGTPVFEDKVFSDDEDDEVDWEDVEDDKEDMEEDEKDSKPAATTTTAPLQPITINFSRKKKDGGNKFHKNNKKTKRVRRTRKVYRNKSLSPQVGQLLQNLHKTHVLAMSSRAVLISECCSNNDLLHLAHSLLPTPLDLNNTPTTTLPSVDQVRKLCTWYFDFVNRVDQRRRAQWRSNAAAGASTKRRRTRSTTKNKKSAHQYHDPPSNAAAVTTTPLLLVLIQLCSHLSSSNDENPQLDDNDDATNCYRSISRHDKVQLLVTLARSLGWRARYVVALDPMSQDFDVHHPLFFLGTVVNVFDAVYKKSKKRAKIDKQEADDAAAATEMAMAMEDNPKDSSLAWVEILCQGNNKKMKWLHVQVDEEWIDRPRSVESLVYAKKNKVNLNVKRQAAITYALGVEHILKDDDDDSKMVFRLTDVTPRYANSWSKSQRLRGDDCNSWFGKTIQSLNVAGGTASKKKQRQASSGRNVAEAIAVEESNGVTRNDSKDAAEDAEDEVEQAEKAELSESAAQETMPTSKVGFKNHAAYALLSQLGTREVLAPNAKKHICGMFKGELVHRRSNVSTAKVAKKWLYEGRKVKDGEKPVKRVKARKKAAPTTFRQLDSYGVGASNDGSEDFRQRQIEVGSAPESDGKEDLFAIWQTASWSPDYIGPNDEIPVNEYRNVELALLNPGLVHMDRRRMAQVAKKLGIPYAPCLLGFEGHGGNRTPTIRGIVVHEHSVDILKEAFTEFDSHMIEQEHKTRKDNALKRWKKLIHGVLLKDRLNKEYGEGKSEA